MVASAVFILDLKGKVQVTISSHVLWDTFQFHTENLQVLISRNYRGDIPMTAVEKFMPLVLQAEEEEQTPTPIVSTEDGINFLYIRHSNLYCTSDQGGQRRRWGRSRFTPRLSSSRAAANM